MSVADNNCKRQGEEIMKMFKMHTERNTLNSNYLYTMKLFLNGNVFTVKVSYIFMFHLTHDFDFSKGSYTG